MNHLQIANKIKMLQKKSIFVGTSSWKYEGWKGLVYCREYQSKKDFEQNCLSEYAQQFSTVGVDHTYYTWPTSTIFQKYFDQIPEGFKLGLKVTEKISVWKYPQLARYGKEAGTANETFLHPDLFLEKFMKPLEKFQTMLGPIMFEFSKFYPGMIANGSEFTDRLGKFLQHIRSEYPHSLFAVEIRNSSWLKPAYFQLLSEQKVAHVLNSWTHMPTIAEQLEVTANFNFPALITRLLLRPGRSYEKAVESFSPYDKIQDPQPETRQSTARLIQRALTLGIPAYVFVNNRCEGSAPQTIAGILEKLSEF